MACIFIKDSVSVSNLRKNAKLLYKLFERTLSDEYECHAALTNSGISRFIIIGPELGILVLNISNVSPPIVTSLLNEYDQLRQRCIDSIRETLKLINKFGDEARLLSIPIGFGTVFTDLTSHDLDCVDIQTQTRFTDYAIFSDQLSHIIDSRLDLETRLLNMMEEINFEEINDDEIEVINLNIEKFQSSLDALVINKDISHCDNTFVREKEETKDSNHNRLRNNENNNSHQSDVMEIPLWLACYRTSIVGIFEFMKSFVNETAQKDKGINQFAGIQWPLDTGIFDAASEGGVGEDTWTNYFDICKLARTSCLMYIASLPELGMEWFVKTFEEKSSIVSGLIQRDNCDTRKVEYARDIFFYLGMIEEIMFFDRWIGNQKMNQEQSLYSGCFSSYYFSLTIDPGCAVASERLSIICSNIAELSADSGWISKAFNFLEYADSIDSSDRSGFIAYIERQLETLMKGH